MNFIKKAFLSSSKSSVNVSALYSNQQRHLDLKDKDLQRQLQKEYEQLKANHKEKHLNPKYQAYLDLLQSFLEYKNHSKNKKIQTLISSLNFNNKKKDKQIPLFNAYSHFTQVEKYKFLIDTLKYAQQKQILTEKQKNKGQTLSNSRVSIMSSNFSQSQVRIISDASISLNELNALSLSYWTKVKFELNCHKREITVTGKESFIAYLQNYLVRLSKKQKHCFVLESCNNEQVPSWLRKIYIQLEKQIFPEAFQSIWNSIIIVQLEIITANFQDACKTPSQFSPMKQKKQDPTPQCQDQFEIQDGDYLVFLTPLMIKNYFTDKSKLQVKIKQKLKFSEYKEIQFANSEQYQGIKQKLEKITYSKASDQKNHQFYRVAGHFCMPASIVKFKFIDSLKQRNKFISSWQILEKQSSSSMSAISQTFNFSSIFENISNLKSDFFLFKQLTLKQEINDYGNDKKVEILVLKSIKQLQKSSLLKYMLVQCQKNKNQHSLLQITCEFNKNILRANLNKHRNQNISKELAAQMNKKIIQNFLREIIMMIFTKSKIYQEKQVDDQQFFTICESFNNQMNGFQKYSSKEIKSVQEIVFQDENNAYNQDQEFFNSIYEKNHETESIKKSASLENNHFHNCDQFQTIPLQSKLKKSSSIQDEIGSQKIQKQNFISRSFILENSKKVYFKQKFTFYPTEKPINPALVKQGLLLQDWRRLAQGGLYCINQKKVREQKQILKKILAKLGQNILKQKSIMNVSLPVTIFKLESQLTTIARALTYAPLLLEPHSYANKQKIAGNLQRIKKVIIFLVSNNYSQINFEKPFNPILGQTLQLWIDGCPLYFEQISHHPQISYFYFLGRSYKMYGAIEPKISMGINHAKIFSWCIKKIQFQDGTTFQTGPNRMMVNGTVFGQRTFNVDQKNYVFDLKSNLLAVISYGPTKKGLFSNSQEPFDFLCGKILKMTDKFRSSEYLKWKERLDYIIKKQWIQSQISSFQGIWNKKMFFNGQEYFDFEKQLPYQLIQQVYPLESDSRHRQDLQWLIAGDVDKSQIYKQKMQEQQRREKKLRAKHKKS